MMGVSTWWHFIPSLCIFPECYFTNNIIKYFGMPVFRHVSECPYYGLMARWFFANNFRPTSGCNLTFVADTCVRDLFNSQYHVPFSFKRRKVSDSLGRSLCCWLELGPACGFLGWLPVFELQGICVGCKTVKN